MTATIDSDYGGEDEAVGGARAIAVVALRGDHGHSIVHASDERAWVLSRRERRASVKPPD
jgi:hypothetical protein